MMIKSVVPRNPKIPNIKFSRPGYIFENRKVTKEMRTNDITMVASIQSRCNTRFFDGDTSNISRLRFFTNITYFDRLTS